MERVDWIHEHNGLTGDDVSEEAAGSDECPVSPFSVVFDGDGVHHSVTMARDK